MSDILDSGLADLIAALRAERGFPGATAAVALAGGRTLVAAAGMADPDAGVAMAPDAVMLQASVGKMYVGAIARMLADQGVLSLDAPVADYLGARPWFARLPNHATMRLRHLLSHSAGLHDYMNVPAFAPLAELILGDPDQFCDPERLIGCILDLPPLFAPGEAFAYSDAAFLVAGLAIEAAAGAGYYDLVRRLVLEPWGLGETFAADRRRIPGLVPGFRGPNPMGLPRRSMEDGALTLHPGSEWAGGGWASSSGDMARFALRLLGGPDSRHRDAVKANAQPAAAPISGSYGLGVLVSDSPLGERFGHGGWTPGYRTDVHCYPAHGMAVAVMVNADDPACASGDDLLAFGARVAAYAAEHPILQQGDSRDV